MSASKRQSRNAPRRGPGPTSTSKRSASTPRSDSRRFSLLLGALSLALVLVGARLVQLQVIEAPAYAAKAERQRVRDIKVPARRGVIYDREGQPLAVSVDARTIYAAPNQIVDKTRTAAALAEVLGGTEADYLSKLEGDSGFVYIERKTDLEKAEQLEALELEGIGLLEDSRRVYPSGTLGCQLLGFVGVDDVGLAGIEKRYDEMLGGVPGTLLAERDPYGRPIPGGIIRSTDPVDGSSITLTIDEDIQYVAQSELAAAVKKWKASSGSIVVMNPRNGEIYAMSSMPVFDPNEFRTAEPEAIRNRAVSDAYEPGSTIKALTAASVIDEGLYSPESKFGLPPTLRVADRVIHESHPRAPVTWTLTEIVTNSSNVGAVKLGQALGEESLYGYFDRFGLTSAAGIDFPGEAVGLLPPTSQWSASSLANIPFGQGLSVTPMQLSRAIGAIANGGVLPTPHLLLDIPEHPESVPEWPTERAISADAAAQTTKILEEVVTDGTGDAARVPGYRVAGKTGTAQKPRADGRGYRGGGYVGSFIGYLPAEDPQVLVCVTLDGPRNAIYGGVVAAPTFGRVAQFAVSHLDVPPSSTSEGKATDGKQGAEESESGG